MSSESGFRTIIARPNGGVAVLAVSAKRQGGASLDGLLSRAERKAGGTVVARIALKDAPSDRRLRNAWVIVDGKARIDLMKARRMKAREWAREGAELRRFIRDEMIPYARIMGERDAVDRLNTALGQIDGVMLDLEARMRGMTEAELASHVPGWPQLGGSDDP